jgi:hypothetical protein
VIVKISFGDVADNSANRQYFVFYIDILMIMDNILSVNCFGGDMLKPEVDRKTPDEMTLFVAERCKNLRLFKGYARKTLSGMSGVPESSIKHFEITGKISFMSLLKIAFVLDALPAFESLFELPPAKTLLEIEKRYERKLPKRGKK